MPRKSAPPKAEIRDIALADLKPAPYNPRRIDPAAMAALTKSFERFGCVEPIVWNERSGFVVGGHQRLKVLRGMKLKTVPVMVVDLDETDEKALNVALNSPHLSGEFTVDLQALLDELRSSEEQLFHDLRLDALLAEQPPPIGADPDCIPSTPKVAITKRGDVYELGQHRLLCGDATSSADIEALMAGELADVLWTDPPYNVQYVGKTPDALTIKNDAMNSDVFRAFLLAAFTSARAALKPGASAYIAHGETEGINFRSAFVEAGFYLASCLIWRKNTMVLGHSDYHYRHEPILYGWRSDGPHTWFGDRRQTTINELTEPIVQRVGDSLRIAMGDEIVVVRGSNLSVERFDGSVFCEDKPVRSAEHPTTKPIALIERMLRNSAAPGYVVLDLFGGSGSTLIACEGLHLMARLVELDALYCDVIVQRWEDFTGKKATIHRAQT